MILTIVHGQCTPEELESLVAVHTALDEVTTDVEGTADSTTWHLSVDELPTTTDAVLRAGCESHTGWKVTRSVG